MIPKHMTYETFCKYMQPLIDFDAEVKAAAKAIGDTMMVGEHRPWITLGDKLNTAYINLLMEMVGDTGEWINYWMYECDMGQKPMSWTDKDGNDHRIETLTDLWTAIQSTK